VVETRARIEGTGSADAQVLVVRDRAAPTVIGTLHLEATEHPDERLRSWPLGDVGGRGTLGAIEWAIVRASRGARVILEGPAVLGPEAAKGADHAKRPSARGVVVVVMSQLGPRSLSPYGGSMATPTLSALASTGTVFDANRATTGVASGAVASMLTGLPARELGMTDATTRLPHGATTVADAARQAGIASAMFTANPLSSSAFGFDRSWSHFEAHGPKEEGPSARVFDAAATWLEEQGSGSFLLVVHARGAHPPWDVTAERQKALPPASYAGGLDPHHAGELLGRSVRASGTGRFDDADSARAWALCGAAMESEDAGLAKLLGTLKALGREETTTVIVTGDVGLDDRGRVLLTESDSVEDAALATPLIVRWARTPARGDHVASATSGEDVATTMLAAFGLSPPDSFRGRDLWTMASGSDSSAPRPSLAMAEDRFSLRWGSFVSSGVRDHETKLCDVTLEPACVTDVRDGYPIASRLLHAVLYDDLVARKPSFDREAAALDAAALADLKVWGR
jgi:arylsulfatase A-like enzyme